MISIEKVYTLVLLLRLVWHSRRKNFLSCFMVVWDYFVCVFMNIFGLLLKTEITLYGTTLSFIMNLLPFCMSIILVWCVECLVVWRLCKRTITSVIKYKYNTKAIQLQCKNIHISIHYNILKWQNIALFFYWTNISGLSSCILIMLNVLKQPCKPNEVVIWIHNNFNFI